jgi:hypothetical protein
MGDQEVRATEGAAGGCAIALQESHVGSSLVMVNSGMETIKPELFRVAEKREVPIHVGTLAPESTVEVPLDEALFREVAPHHCIFGLLRAERLFLGAHTRRRDAEYYLVYREPETKRLVSVVAL